MDHAQMRERSPTSPLRGPGWLTGWRLTFAADDDRTTEFSYGGARATLVQEPGSSVYVMLFDVPPADQAALEMWEGDGYRTLKIRVDTLEGSDLAWTFVFDGYEGGLPTATYLGALSEAAEGAGAPADYVLDLRTRPCRSDP